MIKKTLFAVAVAAALSISAVAFAGPSTDAVKAKQTELFKLVETNKDGVNAKKIAAVFDEMLDYESLAKSSLGDEWGKRTAAEQAEFTGLLKQLVQKAYERNLKKTLGYDIEYLGESADGDATVVKTKAKSKTDSREEPIEINFRMVQKNGKWRVEDIVTEGVSLVSSYRTQFTKIIKKDGFPALITKMKDKIAKGEV